MSEERERAGKLVARVAIDIDAYRERFESLTKDELGRPHTILENLANMIDHIVDTFRAGGLSVTAHKPPFDYLAPDVVDKSGRQRPQHGRYIPSKNPHFLEAHRANLRAFDAALAMLRCD